MNRRAFLRNASITGAVLLSGCFGFRDDLGSNHELILHNSFHELVQANVIVQRERFKEGGKTVIHKTIYDETVSVDPGNQTVLNVLGDASYQVSVTWGSRVLEFDTTPDCNNASTRVEVTEDGTMVATIEHCGGYDHTVTSHPTNQADFHRLTELF